jgi:ribosomal protein S18 acetylase RimI-like enzyme
MTARSAELADLALLTELYRRWDTAAFGAPEHDADEVRETFGDPDDFAERSRLLFADDRLVAAAWYWSGETTVLVDPDADPAPLHADLVGWLAERGAAVDALATDTSLRAALATRGYRHEGSSFELLRTVTPDWAPAEPRWPDGIAVSDLTGADLVEIHRLIYVDAGWTEIPGHPDRPFAQWREIFVTDKEDPAQQVLARRDGRLVGVSMGRIFSDGAGWVAQLAVAKSERGRGLGRALLLESLRRRIAAGATMVGLSVQAPNTAAIGLYLDVGLTIDREWQHYLPPAD